MYTMFLNYMHTIHMCLHVHTKENMSVMCLDGRTSSEF
jgi:hypothetical protein